MLILTLLWVGVSFIFGAVVLAGAVGILIILFGLIGVLLRFVVAGFSAATGAADAALLRRLDVLVAAVPLV